MTACVNNNRVLIVDDDDKHLASLRRIMHGYFKVVTSKDPLQALKIFEYQGPFAAVISDYRMPLMNGIELLSRMIQMDKNVQRIMLTGHADLQMAIDAVNQGRITAFLTKPTPTASLRSVIIAAVREYNQPLIDNSSNILKPGYSLITTMHANAHNRMFQLTAKEKEVLALLSKGFSNEEISINLNITVGTVKTHLTNLFRKLDVNSRTKVVAKGLETGLVKLS